MFTKSLDEKPLPAMDRVNGGVHSRVEASAEETGQPLIEVTTGAAGADDWAVDMGSRINDRTNTATSRTRHGLRLILTV